MKKESYESLILGEIYLIVPVSAIIATQRSEEKTVKSEAARARAVAEKEGYNPKTQQRMTEHSGNFYTFRKE